MIAVHISGSFRDMGKMAVSLLRRRTMAVKMLRTATAIHGYGNYFLRRLIP